jgi:hypothetical protein
MKAKWREIMIVPSPNGTKQRWACCACAGKVCNTLLPLKDVPEDCEVKNG